MKKKRLFQRIISLIILVIAIHTIKAETVQVNDSITADTEWTADTVQIMGNIAVAPGITLTIVPGTYVEFQGHYYLNIYGGLIAVGTENENIIFTINDTTGFYDNTNYLGGWAGINFVGDSINSSSTVKYCEISYGKKVIHTSTFDELMLGGGIFIEQDKSIQIANNIIHHNKSVFGSAISTEYCTDSCKINANLVYDNYATSYGTISLSSNSSCIITNNIVYQNRAAKTNAGICGFYSPVKIINNTVVQNIVYEEEDGGGIYIYNTAGSSVHIYNNIINSNSLLNEVSIYNSDGGLIEISNNNISGEIVESGDDINISNLILGEISLANPNDMDFRIEKDSPAKDAGISEYEAIPELDFNGNNRIQGASIDLGAIEYNYILEPTKYVTINECIQGEIKTNTSGSGFLWFRDDTLIMSATNSSFIIDTVTPSDTNLYTCYYDSSDYEGKIMQYKVSVYPPIGINLGDDILKYEDEEFEITIENGYHAVEWSNGETDDTLSIEAEELSVGEHKIWVEAEDLCGNFSYDTLLITIEESITDLTNNELDFGILLQPNPSNGLFYYHCNQNITEAGAIVEITDITGKTIEKKQITNEHTEFDLTNYPKGMYFVKTIVENKYDISKVIID